MQLIPQYKSHKVVGALQINTVERIGKFTVILTFMDAKYDELTMDIEHLPVPVPGWYLIYYPDGYKSFSPPSEFESGYETAGEQKETIKLEADYTIEDAVSGLRIRVVKGKAENHLHIEHISKPMSDTRDFWFAPDGTFSGLGTVMHPPEHEP